MQADILFPRTIASRRRSAPRRGARAHAPRNPPRRGRPRGPLDRARGPGAGAARRARESWGHPVKVSTREEEATVVRNVYCHLRLRRGDRSEILRFPEVASFEALEFKVAFALWRLVNGRSPHVVFVSDSPRLAGGRLGLHAGRPQSAEGERRVLGGARGRARARIQSIPRESARRETHSSGRHRPDDLVPAAARLLRDDGGDGPLPPPGRTRGALRAAFRFPVAPIPRTQLRYGVLAAAAVPRHR